MDKINYFSYSSEKKIKRRIIQVTVGLCILILFLLTLNSFHVIHMYQTAPLSFLPQKTNPLNFSSNSHQNVNLPESICLNSYKVSTPLDYRTQAEGNYFGTFSGKITNISSLSALSAVIEIASKDTTATYSFPFVAKLGHTTIYKDKTFEFLDLVQLQPGDTITVKFTCQYNKPNTFAVTILKE